MTAFYSHSLDRVLQRLDHEAAIPEVLWPDGRWAPDPAVDLGAYGTPLSEDEAQAFADAYCGRRVELHAAG